MKSHTSNVLSTKFIYNNFSLLILFIIFGDCQSQNTLRIEWQERKLQEGIHWKYIVDKELNGIRQTINVVEIDLAIGYSFKMAYDSLLLEKSSIRAMQEKAIFAINGNFFDPQNGGSVCYFKNNDKLVNPSKPDPEQLLFLPMLDEGAVVWNDSASVRIISQPKHGWASLKNVTSILSSGPILLKNAQFTAQENIPFISDRHARSAIGLSNEKLMLVVVDGYRAQSSGMSIPELAKLMQYLGCETALNLDGGGSSTLWAAPQGVLNYPTDNNKNFDHEGERAVANTFLVIPKKKNLTNSN